MFQNRVKKRNKKRKSKQFYKQQKVAGDKLKRKNEKKVYEKLCDLVEEWIEIYGEDNAPLPSATAGKQYSGKFNLRVGEELHERLAIESMKVSESLNSYCVKVLKDEFGS